MDTSELNTDSESRDEGDAHNSGKSKQLLKARYVLAVWGERYIDRYFELAFPTHLADENLPAVAARTDLSFAILTRSQDVERFQQSPLFAEMERLGAVEFVSIDDLISHNGVFTVTLTLAFTRALRLAGAAAPETCFFFMNADFMLANGTLATAVDRIINGADAVLTASPRSISEELEQKLPNWPRSPNGALSIKPRDMVALSLSAPHAMVYAKQPALKLLHSTQPNQFFWFVDDDTLLVRSYLMFMLAVRPNRENYQATNYCDYSLVSDLVDEERISVVSDSDDGFILEMQARRQEHETIRLGPLPLDYAVTHLGEWTTSHHRLAAQHALIFHAGPLPAELVNSQRAASRFMEKLEEKLPPPVDAHNHPYWWGGVDAWLMHRDTAVLPNELAPRPSETAETSNSRHHEHPTTAHNNLASIAYRTMRRIGAQIRDNALLSQAHGDLGSVRRAMMRLTPSDQLLLTGSVPQQLTQNLPDAVTVKRPLTELGDLTHDTSQYQYLIVGLAEQHFDMIDVAVAAGHRVAEDGGTAYLLISQRRLKTREFQARLLEVLTDVDQTCLTHAMARLADATGNHVREQALVNSIADFRASPHFGGLLRTAGQTIRFALFHARQNVMVRMVPGWQNRFRGLIIAFSASKL